MRAQFIHRHFISSAQAHRRSKSLRDNPGNMVKLMNIRKLFTITLICVGFAAGAQGDVVSQGHELTLSQFTAPTTNNSNIAFKECDDCDQLRTRVTNATSYSIDGKRVRLDEFRSAVSQVRDRDSASVTVLRHLESNTVLSISVTQ